MVMTFISHIYRAVGPFGEKFDFLVPWDLKLDATERKSIQIKPTFNQSFRMIPSDKNPIHDQETALIYQFCTESFESALNIYVFICNKYCDQIITQSAKIKLITSRWKGERLPEKVVIDEMAQALCFSGVNYSLSIRHWEVTFFSH